MEKSEVAVIVDDLEEKAEVTSFAESSKEMKAASNPDSGHLEKPAAMEVEEGSRPKWSPKEITSYDSHASLLLKWKKIFLASCVSAVLLDPLFLYIPVINHDTSCLGVDDNLKITALILRSVTDLFYVMEIALQFYGSAKNYSGLISNFRRRHFSILQLLWKIFFPAIAKTCWHSYILIDILAILPLPQVLILIFYSKMRGSSSLNATKVIMNLFVLMQYFPRVLRIYLSCKELGRTHIGGTATWVKGVLNFFMYILASHVLGAVWYFLAIQRMTDCWQYACGNRNDQCDRSFGCHDDHIFRNITYLNELCPLSTPSTSSFDFGIYSIVLQSGLPGSTNFLQKLSNCFCWGLRNLSSLGSNLQPSIDTWENLFVAFISVIGLLLFIYLIGNLQTYMQLDVARIEEHRHKMRVERKLEEQSRELDLWLSKKGIPERLNQDIKSQMMKKVQLELEENRDVDLENIMSMIPSEVQDYVNDRTPLTRLKQVPTLHYMDGFVLKEICELLKPMKYAKNDIIIPEDEDSLKMMIFIVEGNIVIEKPNHPCSSRGAGELYGEKLLTWPSRTSFPAVIPSASESVKAIGDVEALVLMASDMESVASKFSFHFRKNNVLEEQLDNLQTPIRVFTAQEMKKATNNFHDSNKRIGEGGSAVVYKGTLLDRTVAIKQCRVGTFRTDKLVKGMSVLSKISHKNVARLLGCCMEMRSLLLVYEYGSNGTLYDHIHENGKGSISWELRMNIAVDSARGLQYLHYSTSMPIIHAVKTTNILIDNHFTAKVSGFEASQFKEYDQCSSIKYSDALSSGVPGYLFDDPDLLRSNRVTEKSHAYGFGVVLAELITSGRALDYEFWPEQEKELANFFVLSVETGHLDEIVDSEIINETNFEMVKKVAELARRCLRMKGADKPTINEIVSQLEGLQIMAMHPDGEKPQFSRFHKDSDYLLGSPSYVYDVDVTKS